MMIISFYDSGYHDGFAHGRIHGLIEGRALGREKGFEMWEEIGFYEGFALTWRAILKQQSKEDELRVDFLPTFPPPQKKGIGPLLSDFFCVVSADPPNTSDIFSNIFLNFHALTYPAQKMTLLPQQIYQDF